MGFLDLTGLDIKGEVTEQDKRSLAEVRAFAQSDHYVNPTQETTETFLKMQEENTAAMRPYRLLNDGDYKNEEERKGTILSENEFIARLRKLIPIRVNEWSARGLRGISVWQNGSWHYVCAMQCGYMPEFSLMYFDSHRVAQKEKMRGWRTVLLNLITKGFITEEAAHAEFGAPIQNQASRLYREKLWNYRNRENKDA